MLILEDPKDKAMELRELAPITDRGNHLERNLCHELEFRNYSPQNQRQVEKAAPYATPG